MGKVSEFAAWLRNYSALLCALEVDYAGGAYSSKSEEAALEATCKQLLEFGLQAAASAAASGSGASLRLQSYSSFVGATAGLLAALPAATLTHLDVIADRSPWFGNMAMLTNLRQLRLWIDPVPADTVNNRLQEVGRLCKLTQLELGDVPVGSDMQLLPDQLQLLNLTYKGYHPVEEEDEELTDWSQAVVNLQHMTALQHLSIKAVTLADGSSLPPDLQLLELHGQWAADGLLGVSSLHQVTSVKLVNWTLCSDNLEVLQHLPQLKKLALNLEVHGDPLDVAPAWRGLPLCDLQLQADAMTGAEVQQLMQHVAAATMLTMLKVRIDDLESLEPPGLAACEQLTALTHLKELNLAMGDPDSFVQQDAQHLSALVTLTSLDLCFNESGPYLDGAILCLLALMLTRLKHLSINVLGDYKSEVGFIHALPVVGRLTTLECLFLHKFNASEAQRGLQYLTGLSRLKQLSGFSMAGDAAWNSFWVAIRNHHAKSEQ